MNKELRQFLILPILAVSYTIGMAIYTPTHKSNLDGNLKLMLFLAGAVVLPAGSLMVYSNKFLND